MNLDLGCGYRLSPGFVGIDIKPLDELFPGLKPPHYEGNYIEADLWNLPWPVESDDVDVAHANYLVNYIPHDFYLPVQPPHELPHNPGLAAFNRLDGFYLFFEELYRVMKPFGRVQITYEPYTAEAAVWNPSIRRLVHPHTFEHLSKLWRDDTIVEDPKCDFIIEKEYAVAGTARQVLLSTVKEVS